MAQICTRHESFNELRFIPQTLEDEDNEHLHANVALPVTQEILKDSMN